MLSVEWIKHIPDCEICEHYIEHDFESDYKLGKFTDITILVDLRFEMIIIVLL